MGKNFLNFGNCNGNGFMHGGRLIAMVNGANVHGSETVKGGSVNERTEEGTMQNVNEG